MDSTRKNFDGEKLAARRVSTDLGRKTALALFFAIVLARTPASFSTHPGAKLAVEFFISTAAYLGCGRPLHREASLLFGRKRIDGYGLLSLGSSVLYWYSLIVSLAWVFFPRFFPLRWLDANLSVPNYFAETCAVIAIGVGFLFIRSLRAAKKVS